MKLRIHLIDLDDSDAALLGRILEFANRQQREYRIVPTASEADLLICDGRPERREPARAAARDSSLPLLLIGAQGPSMENEHALARPLLVTRVLRELDRIAAQAAERPSPTADTTPAPVETPTASETPAPAGTSATALACVQRYAWQARLERAAARPASAVAEPASPPAQAAAGETPESGPESASRYRALVVDDSLAIRKQLELELRDAGIAADFAEDGEIALEKAANNHYDLIFLDIMMPGIDGYEVCRELRKQPQWKKTPITMLSGKTSPLDEVQGVLAGCSTYLTKPIRHDDFQKMLERVQRWIDTVKQKSD